MCLIIDRQPNFEIPYDKFESAILNNPDGYGLTYPSGNNDGKLITLRSADKADPEGLYKLINEDLINEKIMVHLRYTTVGETILRNAHPFPILERESDGIDLRMAHNGTLSKFKPGFKSSESDTRVFVREFVRPLFKRLIRGMDPEELLSDSFTKLLLEDQLSMASVITFLDGEGNSLICNEEGNGGKQEDDWYYSNTYSFNPKHRVKPATPVTYNTGYTASGYNQGTTLSVVPPKGTKFKDCSVMKFTRKHGMTSIKDAFHMSDDLIEEVVNKKPDDAVLLIKELLYELELTGKELDAVIKSQ